MNTLNYKAAMSTLTCLSWSWSANLPLPVGRSAPTIQPALAGSSSYGRIDYVGWCAPLTDCSASWRYHLPALALDYSGCCNSIATGCHRVGLESSNSGLTHSLVASATCSCAIRSSWGDCPCCRTRTAHSPYDWTPCCALAPASSRSFLEFSCLSGSISLLSAAARS